MQRKRFDTMACPIARGLDRVGEWWSILILRDAFAGMTRFEQFEKSLGIAPAMLTRRLKSLVANGLLARQRYSEKPPRDEYRLTAKGADFRPVLITLMTWGNAHFSPEGAQSIFVDTRTGLQARPVLVDEATGQKLEGPDFKLAPGPGAGAGMRLRIANSRLLGASA